MPNGLLLRSDVHRLFDNGYVTITPLRFDWTHREALADLANWNLE